MIQLASTLQSFFEWLLEYLGILSIPGTGFGALGDGLVHLPAFQLQEQAEETITRISKNRCKNLR